MTNKEFWKKLKSFLTNKGCFSEDQISIEVNDELVSGEKILTEIFDEHYINIVEKSSGKIFRKINISYPMIRPRTCAYQGLRNVNFSENFVYVLNG